MLGFVASSHLTSKWSACANVTQTASTPLTQNEVAAIIPALEDDGFKCVYSALISIGDAARGLEAGFYSWSGVKLYYSAFYAVRAYLAFNGICVFSLGGKLKWASIKSGEYAQDGPRVATSKSDGSTHKMITNLFSVTEPNHILLLQEIGLLQPMQWLVGKREEFNYRNAKFVEPDCPECFAKITTLGIR